MMLVIGSIIGGGVFGLPSELSKGSGGLGILLGFCISGIGVLSLAWVYYLLAMRRPQLNNGIYAYSRAGFGDYIGFNTAWLYWVSSTLGNVSYATLVFGTLAYFFSVFNLAGNNFYALVASSILIWLINLFIIKGMRRALIINIIINIAKLAPIVLFVLVGVVFFHWKNFTDQFFGGANLGSLYHQVKTTMITNLWAFGGLEAAVVLSIRAKNPRSVGKATVFGLVCIVAIYMIVMVVALGILPRAQMANLPDPSLSYVFAHAIGPIGAVITMLGLLVSVFGSLLGWTIITAEMPSSVAKDGLMPRFLAKENANGTPTYAIFFTTLITQAWLLFSYFNHSDYRFLYSLASTSGLIPYVFSVLYLLKIQWKSPTNKKMDYVIPIVALFYAIWILAAAGWEYTLFSTLISLSGVGLFLLNQKRWPKTQFEQVFMLTMTVLALGTAYALHQHWLTIG